MQQLLDRFLKNRQQMDSVNLQISQVWEEDQIQELEEQLSSLLAGDLASQREMVLDIVDQGLGGLDLTFLDHPRPHIQINFEPESGKKEQVLIRFERCEPSLKPRETFPFLSAVKFNPLNPVGGLQENLSLPTTEGDVNNFLQSVLLMCFED